MADGGVRARAGFRIALEIAGDCLGWALGLSAAMFVRFDGVSRGWQPFFPARLAIAVLIAMALTTASALLANHIAGRQRYGSFDEVLRLAVVDVVIAVVLMVVSNLLPEALLPNSVIVGGAVAALVTSFGLRYLFRLRREMKARPSASAERVLVFGAGEGGEQTITAMVRNPLSPYRPVAVLDDDPSKHGMVLRGVRVVGGRDALARVAKEREATGLVIAVPHAGSDLVREIAGLGVDAGLKVRILPAVSELFGAPIGVEDIRPITEEDLLGRAAVETDLNAVAGYLHGRRVLVTGAGGSIGSEICRQVWHLAPSELVMLDRDESALHSVQLELEGRAMLDSRNLVVADIRDRERVFRVMEEHRPEVVFHAAALKHLPLLEMYPSEAVKSNVIGTKNVLDAAAAVGVGHFVNISTDKAADPVSVLGWSKRVAEGLTATTAEHHPGRYLSVRFGNVLGSRGSVLTSFRAQIERGGPITVTDPDVTRYFMTVREAVHLVIQAGAVGGDGEALVLDMGEPVRIADVAEQLASQAARPIDVVYTGLRPGEKLHEVLLGEGEVDVRPAHPLISHVRVPSLPGHALQALEGVEADDDARRVLQLVCATTMALPDVGAHRG